jgi:hypothetical protein
MRTRNAARFASWAGKGGRSCYEPIHPDPLDHFPLTHFIEDALDPDLLNDTGMLTCSSTCLSANEIWRDCDMSLSAASFVN